jgi:hypothetical protein
VGGDAAPRGAEAPPELSGGGDAAPRGAEVPPELMLYPTSVGLLGISVFGLPSFAQTTFISSVRGILPSGLRLSSTNASGLGGRLWCVFWRVWGGRRIQARASSPCGRPRRLSDGSWISVGLS